MLLERAKLDKTTLYTAWELSDRTGQSHPLSRLAFPEFLALMHFVTCVKRGGVLPRVQDGCPQELQQCLATLERPEDLEAQRSRSPSPTGRLRSTRSQSTSPIFPAAAPMSPEAGESGLGAWPTMPQTTEPRQESPRLGNMGAQGTILGSQMAVEAPWATASDAFGQPPSMPSPQTEIMQPMDTAFGSSAFPESSAWGAEEPSKNDKKHSKKHSRHHKKDREGNDSDKDRAERDRDAMNDGYTEGFGAGSRSPSHNSKSLPAHSGSSAFSSKVTLEPLGSHSRGSSPASNRGHRSPDQPGSRSLERLDADIIGRDQGYGSGTNAPGFGSTFDRLSTDVRSDRVPDLSSVRSHFEAVIQADQAISRGLKREVDELEDELRQTSDVRTQLDQTLRREKQSGALLEEQRRELERQLQSSKQRLVDLREDRKAVNLESISLRRDREHFAEELKFLQRTAEDEEQTLETMRRSNTYLEKSYQNLESHTVQLELQRKEILEQVASEKETMRQEERQNAELRNKLERMRREQAASTAGYQEAHHREQQLREMQSGQVPSRVFGAQTSSLSGASSNFTSGRAAVDTGLGVDRPDRPSVLGPGLHLGGEPDTTGAHNLAGEKPHSWAFSLVGAGNAAAPGAALGSAPSRTGPRSREGV